MVKLKEESKQNKRDNDDKRASFGSSVGREERERERVRFGGDDVYYYRVGTALSKLSGDAVLQSLWAIDKRVKES